MYQEQRRLTDDLQRVNEQLQAANLSFAMGLIATLDARDRYTAGHSAAVAIYARDIAERMGLDQDQQDLAHLFVLVDDIGKIGLAAGILEKPGALTLEERREMSGIRRSESGSSRTSTRTQRSLQSFDTITNAWMAKATQTRLRGRISRFSAHHCGCRCLQRDDLRSSVPRCDAE